MAKRAEIELLWNDIGPLSGWDFSRLNVERAPVPWDYESVVLSTLTSEHDVLDVGTGGGEKLARMAVSFRSAVGIDFDPAMIETANQNVPENLSARLSFRVGKAETTGQDSSSVDGVINRHSVVDVGEIDRVLKAGGFFISQQVGDRNLVGVLAPFGGQKFESDQHPETIRGRLVDHGIEIVRFEEYDVEYRFLDLESVLFQVKAIVGYLGVEITLDGLEQMVNSLDDGSGEYASNEHRWLIVARKSAGLGG
jgi:SAM-dependent methyltransferase